MLSSECAAHFLERDQLLHIDMLECIRRGNATCLYVGERGVPVSYTHLDVYKRQADDRP